MQLSWRRFLLNSSLCLLLVDTGKADVIPSVPDNEPVGGTVKIDYVHNVTVSGQSFLYTRENSTMFTHNAPIPPSQGIWGELVPFSPIDACSRLELSNYTKKVGNRIHFKTVGPYPHVVALVARGKCSFEEKFDLVDNVPNVIGMVMYDLPDGDSLSTDIEISTFRLTSIPGFLIDYKTGIALKEKVDQMRKEDQKDPTDPLWVKVTLKYMAFSGPVESILQFILLFVMALLSVAFIASVYMHYHIYRLQQQLGEQRQNQARSAIVIDDAFFEKLMLRKFHKQTSPIEISDGAGVSHKYVSTESLPSMQEIAAIELEDHIGHAPPNETCPICLDEFRELETVNELPCGHYYHITCIQPWLRCRSTECPMCKYDVRDAFIAPVLGESESVMEIFWRKVTAWCKRWLCCNRQDPNQSSERDASLGEMMSEVPRSEDRNIPSDSLNPVP